jgi:hypothetical protein
VRDGMQLPTLALAHSADGFCLVARPSRDRLNLKFLERIDRRVGGRRAAVSSIIGTYLGLRPGTQSSRFGRGMLGILALK